MDHGDVPLTPPEIVKRRARLENFRVRRKKFKENWRITKYRIGDNKSEGYKTVERQSRDNSTNM